MNSSKLLGAAQRGRTVEPVHAADKVQVLGAGQAFEQAHALWHYADLALNLHRVGGKIQPEKLHATGRGCEQPGEHFNGGGFSRAIGAEEAEKVPRGDLQIDIVHSRQSAETTRQLLGHDGHVAHCIPRG